MTDSFTHLHVHTEFSMLDGAARLPELVAKAVEDGQPAIGMTDHGNMYGTLDFYKECNEQGIKPIIGTEAYMAHDHRSERPARRGRVDDSGGETDTGQKLYYHLTLLAEDNTGYRNLIQLASLAFMEGYYYKPRMDWELLSQHSDGLIATTGCLGGHVLQSLLQGDERGALEKAGRLQEIFGRDNLFVELQDHGLPEQRRTNPQLLEIAKKIGAPLLATNDSHYTHRDDHESHDALLCVQTGSLLSDQNRFKFEGTEHYLKTAEEMRYLFREVPQACDNSLWIAERADVEIEFGNPLLPEFPLPAGFDDDAAYLTHLTWEGARKRWGDDLADVVTKRISYELKTICDMGFASYFLITWDLIKHARDAGIRVGPGRGSAAGCAVAYCLWITDLDPIKYDLLFERFLNPSRISMPDIDMDFDSRYRDEMIRYAAERYGRDHAIRQSEALVRGPMRGQFFHRGIAARGGAMAGVARRRRDKTDSVRRSGPSKTGVTGACNSRSTSMRSRLVKSGFVAVATILGLVGATVHAADSDRTLAAGKQRYMESCAVCHGDNGAGVGIVSNYLTKQPSNLTMLAKNNGGSFPFMTVYKTIDGRAKIGAHGSREMPVWGAVYKGTSPEAAGMSEAIVRGRILELIVYLESIQE